MKSFLLPLTIFIYTLNAYSQCYPVFSKMASQPTNPGGTFALNEAYRSPRDFYYTMYDQYQGATIYNLWDGTQWTSLKPSILKGYRQLAKWNGKVIALGTMTRADGLYAPAQKYFGVLVYNNGTWDSLPGSTFDSTFYLEQTCATADNIYISARQPTDPYKGYIFRYDTTQQKFVKIIDYERSTYGILMVAGDKRVLLAKVTKINGTATKGFCTIDNDTIHLNTDSRFDPFMIYGLDMGNDHVYAYKYADDPTVMEYTNQHIQSRSTVLDINGANGDVQALNGKLIWWTNDVNSNGWLNILCPGENQWKRIFIDKTVVYYGNPNVTKTGIYVLDYNNKRSMELMNGARIRGIAYLDNDSNCNHDSTEKILSGQLISARSNDYMTGIVTDDSGRYELYVPLDTFLMKGPAGLSSCSNPNVIATTSGQTITKNIPVQKPTTYDIRVKILNAFRVRWNSRMIYQALVENHGLPYDSAHFRFRLDPKLNIDSGDANVDSIYGNVATGQLKNLDYFDKRIVRVWTWIDSSQTKPDTFVCNSFAAYLYTDDKDSTNNRDSFCQRVVYSLDPNHKDVSREKIAVNTPTRLEYFIGFQNEGNDDAHDVVIKDTLSGNLSLETITITGASHPYTLRLEGRVLIITFNNIFLKPKKQDEALSQGFFKFSITSLPNLQNGDKINNTAYIYFDLNQPVITNTAVVVVSKDVASVKKELFATGSLLVYPNPASGMIHIQTPNTTEKVNIYNTTGQLLYSAPTVNRQIELDISTWPAGIYFVRCGNMNYKFIKMEN